VVRATHFLILNNDLMIDCCVHKFVDDSTLAETLLTRPHTSKMHTYIEQLKAWKIIIVWLLIMPGIMAEEMLLGPLSKSSSDELFIGQTKVERVTGFKLLGIDITSDLKWNTHIDKICAKACSRLYFLKQLKRAGLVADQYTISIYQLLDRY